MNEQDREFLGMLAMVFGPLFMLGGWLVWATEAGAIMMVIGALHLAAAPVLRPTLRIIAVAPLLFLAGFGAPSLLGVA